MSILKNWTNELSRWGAHSIHDLLPQSMMYHYRAECRSECCALLVPRKLGLILAVLHRAASGIRLGQYHGSSKAGVLAAVARRDYDVMLTTGDTLRVVMSGANEVRPACDHLLFSHAASAFMCRGVETMSVMVRMTTAAVMFMAARGVRGRPLLTCMSASMHGCT